MGIGLGTFDIESADSDALGTTGICRELKWLIA